MIVKMLRRLENRVEKVKETFNTVNKITKGIEEIKNKQKKMKNTITEFKNTLEGTNSRITETEEWISELVQCRRPGFNPWFGKILWRKERLPTPVFWPGKFHGQCSPWGRKESDPTE